MFNAAREGTTNSFFSVMQPRLRKQNYIKYVDRSVIDKDLLLRRKQVIFFVFVIGANHGGHV